jgi:hypothetical protein
VPANLYLDDDVIPDLARLLRGRGIDALTSAEAGMVGQADQAHLEFAVAGGRALLSHNYHDFLPLAEQWFRSGRHHHGVVLSFRQFSRQQLGEALQLVLRLLVAVPPAELSDTVRFLDEFR